MSNNEAAQVEVIARAVSDRILVTLDQQGHSVKWLGDTAGIPSSTIHRNIDNAGEFRLKHVIAIAFALNVDFGWLNTGINP